MVTFETLFLLITMITGIIALVISFIGLILNLIIYITKKK